MKKTLISLICLLIGTSTNAQLIDVQPPPQQVIHSNGTIFWTGNYKLIGDEQGTFYALRTFNHLQEKDKLPVIEITDNPGIRYRGVVEKHLSN